MNRNTNFATNTVIQFKKLYKILENNKRSTWPLVWWWVLTHNKKANLPNYEYKLFKTSTFTILYIYSVKDLIQENQKTNC